MKKTVYSWVSILLGCTILAAGFVFFINPYNIIPGGVYGASIVLHNLFPSIQVGTFGYMFDIPLLILSVVLLGAKLGSRTIAAALVTPFIMNMLSRVAYPTQEALERLSVSVVVLWFVTRLLREEQTLWGCCCRSIATSVFREPFCWPTG